MNTMIETCYGAVSKSSKKQKNQLLICDVDGVMSDGLIYMGNNGEELKPLTFVMGMASVVCPIRY